MCNVDDRPEGNCERPFLGLLTNSIKGDRPRTRAPGGKLVRNERARAGTGLNLNPADWE